MWQKLVNKYKLKAGLCVFFLSVESLADILQPLFMAMMINEGVQEQNLSVVIHYGGWMIAIAGIGAFGAAFRNVLSSQVAYGFGADLRQKIYAKIIRLSKAQHDGYSDGELMTLVTSDVNKIQMFVQGILRIFLKAPLIGIGSIVMTLYINFDFWRMYALVLPVVSLLIYLNIRLGYPMFLKIQTALDGLNDRIQSILAGVRVVKAFDQFDQESDKFDQEAIQLQTISQKAHEGLALFPAVITLTVNLSIVYILWQSSSWIYGGSMALGDMMAFVNYQFQVLFALIILTRVFARFVSAKASKVRLEALMAMACPEESGGVMDIDFQKNIRFHRVSFQYGDGTLALENVSFTLEPGTFVGVIGPTGSGKSSLVNLMMKHYKPKSGAIMIGDVDLQDIKTSKWRDQVGVVPQKNILFSGSIRENILWGNPQADDDQIDQSIGAANIQDFVMTLEDKSNALLGRDGVNVSGGQKQRLSIARALVKAPSLLILDDSTSAVDVITESKIKDNLKSTAMTVMMIAQRISSIMDADQIIVLENGKIADRGSHEELLQSCLLYREIFESQLGSEVLL